MGCDKLKRIASSPQYAQHADVDRVTKILFPQILGNRSLLADGPNVEFLTAAAG